MSIGSRSSGQGRPSSQCQRPFVRLGAKKILARLVKPIEFVQEQAYEDEIIDVSVVSVLDAKTLRNYQLQLITEKKGRRLTHGDGKLAVREVHRCALGEALL